MLAFAARRLLTLAFTVLAATLVIFVVLEVLPGNPARIMLGTQVREDTLAALMARLGLDRPPLERYFAWLGDLASGRFGTSYTYNVPVGDLVAERIAVTVPLTLIALLLSTLIAVPLGMVAARFHNRAGDWAVMGFSQLGLAVPNFWLGILLSLAFAVWFPVFASGGFPGWGAGVGPAFAALVLPATALAVSEAAILARVTRSAFLETLGEDYVRTARAKGLSGFGVMVHHVLRNALIPMTTILGLQFAVLMAGAIVIENVFYLPGLGRLIYQAVERRDLIVVRDVVVLIVAMVVVVNAVVDLLYALIDPRPRTAGARAGRVF